MRERFLSSWSRAPRRLFGSSGLTETASLTMQLKSGAARRDSESARDCHGPGNPQDSVLEYALRPASEKDSFHGQRVLARSNQNWNSAQARSIDDAYSSRSVRTRPAPAEAQT